MSAPVPPYSARVLFDYAAVEDGEISVFKGSAVSVREANESGWSLVESGGRSGWVPSDFMEAIEGVSESEQPREEEKEVKEAMEKLNLALAAAPDGSADGGSTGDGEQADKEIAEAAAALQAAGVELRQCGACAKPVTERYVVADEQSYHVACFCCAGCSMSLAGLPFIKHEGAFNCEDCFYRANNPPCGACDDVIRGQYVTALGQSWHPTCFVCTECLQPFESGQFHKKDDRPYCADHYNKLFGVSCSKCSQPIDGQVFEALGKRFHVECFTCEQGAHPIGQDATFHVFEDKVYCSPHFEEIFVQTCARCAETIEAEFIKVADDHFHPACWQCAGCSTQLDRVTVQSRGKSFYCPLCYVKSAAPAPAAAAPAASGGTPSYMRPTRASAVKAPQNLSQRGPSKAAPMNPQNEAKRGGQQFFSYTALTKGVPDGVDPSRKEQYLEPGAFLRIFKMNKSEFDKLKGWKKERAKKAVGLW